MKEIRVLIIEDDPMVIDINRKVVQDIPGFTVVGTARSGTEGLEAINQYKPNLVILDIFMPQLNGLEFLKEMRKNGQDMDVIMVTASQDPLYLKEGMRYGVVDYLIKPFRLDRLKASLENYLNMARRLHGKKSISQEDIDSMVKKTKVEEDIPKGLSLYTLNIIKEFIKEKKQSFTADEIADNLGLARVTARRYLEYLVMTQEVEISLEYGSIGRPVKKYKEKA
ncbi:response regulator [Thermanaerosceptrum fracticalcis]|uniref:Transcriptional regulatory protein n=1 Tax=Thermanaerosceptrum fracticalcis TaxID=1712410 RepID=A0A7G6E730_THEFR|nr:response regulator [Thermanaerosceptrum fracticalcis]QNB47884.1 response regulator [Thermanaerosceptrum fracticalcis]